MTVTVKGKTIPVKLIALLEVIGELMVVIDDDRHFAEIAAEWEDADEIVVAHPTGKTETYTGYSRLTRMTRENDGSVSFALVQE